MLWEKIKVKFILFAKESNANRINWDFPFLRQVGILRPLGGIFGVGFGRYWGVKIGTAFFEKTRVGFGRTELSLRLSCTEFCALSSGHGPRNPRFRRFLKILDFHDFSKSLQRLRK